MRKIIFILCILLAVAAAVNAQIAVQQLAITPEQIRPGEEVSLFVQLQNAGDEDIENVFVRLDLTQVPFIPVGSSSEKVIEEIRDFDREALSFTLRALPDAQPQVYKIPLVITHGTISTTSLIGIEVTSPAHLDVLLESETMMNTPGKVTLKFINDGLSQIQFLKVSLRPLPGYEILSPTPVYIGEVDVGDFETEEFRIMPLIDDPILMLELEYRDGSNHIQRESRLLQLKVYTQEEAQRFGLAEKTPSYLPWIIAFAVVATIFIVYRRRRKRKNAP